MPLSMLFTPSKVKGDTRNSLEEVPLLTYRQRVEFTGIGIERANVVEGSKRNWAY
ncbi:MAG: hypothetical protein U0175_32880 [Caldilineaceae bacterium]